MYLGLLRNLSKVVIVSGYFDIVDIEDLHGRKNFISKPEILNSNCA